MKVIAIEQIRVDTKRLCKFNDTVATAEVREMQQYVCSKLWCGKTFITKINFIRHESSCRRPSKCIKTCYLFNKEFSKVSNLQRHLELHSNKKFKLRNINKKESNQLYPSMVLNSNLETISEAPST